MSEQRKTAVISGGAGGLGRALSDLLLARGWHVVALDLDVTTLNPDVEGVACDLTNRVARDAALAAIAARHPRMDLAVYNAGITQIGGFDDLDEDTHRKVMEINYFAAMAMAQAFLRNIRAARGTHLAISSVAGFAPLHHRVAYAASKHALGGAFASLRSEERAHGVRVQIAAPSFVATNIGNAQQQENGIARPGSAPDGVDYMSPETAAAAILRGVDRGTPMNPIGRVARLSWLLNRLSPRLFQMLMERNIAGR
ncbi:MAG: short-chain dehydrogenase [Rhodobacterales bacterium]|nr:MAG: short-chain dehydrogenase [Rhodobacterales bacterium]